VKLININEFGEPDYGDQDILFAAALEYLEEPPLYEWAKGKTIEEADESKGYCRHNYYVLVDIINVIRKSKRMAGASEQDLACSAAELYLEFHEDELYDDLDEFLEDNGYYDDE
jgi:hypothetical protein